mmetsp:Transcript_20065/g.24799  ORF Transcript_20065/g.24799 Transcript_20065/m.24799 type:complete len:219 (-) Transcript_20065:143-799(-)|eukprot:CAMPEP_0172505510 /NCGR_PEP_ID=MMETSP1066-20121228/186959_1 /TAXON_ID=671091 /ORGANISM="Coscinodiscus wailesii, Strain CCMP2513" /LENGTH=218 /DNA_ID=CAMNT_0013282139 /DNA_START=144 /DNA_END=800 /DNA_ORIENTATION=+
MSDQKLSTSNSNSNESEEDNGSTLPWSLKRTSLFSRFEKFADEQRVERLEQCLELEKKLKNCHKLRDEVLRAQQHHQRKQHMESPSFAQNATAEGSASAGSGGGKGAGLLSIFKWGRNSSNDNVQSKTDDTNAKRTTTEDAVVTSHIEKQVVPSCHDETHKLWACRASALGCGKYLLELNNCFKNGNGVCRVEQEKMGRCVTEEAAALDKRLGDRNED